jgi:signal transduction histidine kinase
MKLRYRLMLSCLIMVILPVCLIATLGIFFFNTQRARFEVAYSVGFGGDVSAAAVSSICEMAGKVVSREIEVEPTRFRGTSSCPAYNDYLMKTMNCFLIVFDGERYYCGDSVSSEFINKLRMITKMDGVQYSPDEDIFYMLVNSDSASQVESGRVFVATFADHDIPAFRNFIILFISCAILVLFLTAALIITGFTKSILNPIRAVQKASRKVRDGDYDYELSIKDREFEPLCDDFNQMRLRLKESEKIKAEADRENQELISNIGHDLKTPLTAIKGYVEGLLDNIADTPKQRERYLNTILNKTNDMQRLIDELCFYSRIDSNRVIYHFLPIPVADFFRDFADETELDLTSRGMKLEFSCEVDDDILVKADPEQLRRVVDNIIGNSVKYMDKPEGEGAIGIRLWADEKTVYVELRDNGPGISEDALPYIFDRFYRADAARNQNQAGSGIGLSIVQKIVEDHGGTVYATSTLGEGTTITIELAIYEEEEDSEDEKDIDR